MNPIAVAVFTIIAIIASLIYLDNTQLDPFKRVSETKNQGKIQEQKETHVLR